MSSELSVTSIHVYPIKSCRAIDLKAARLDELGISFDRRLMVIDAETSRFLTQREEPRMTMISPTLGPTSLQVSAPNMPMLKIDTRREGQRREVTVWRFTGPAEDCGENAASWFSTVLERSVRVVRWADDVQREVNPKYAGAGVLTAFTDGYPILITTEASLEHLNAQASERVSMSRFRPNIVIRGALPPFAEDTWKRIRVGEVEIDVVKPCSRCAITTVDALTAKRGKEPLATLAKLRLYEKETWFGQNCIHRSLGSIRVGDPVEVLETGPASPPILQPT